MDIKFLLKNSHNLINCNKTDYIDNLKIGNNDFVFNEIVLKSFFIHNKTNQLYVFLSAVGSLNVTYPIFQRISWYDKFDGIKIFFDDPTREILKMAPGFYFGKMNISCLSLLKTIIEKIILNFKLCNKNITFISSSNGGFACLYLSNEFLGSKCIALCPQFDVKLFFGDDGFTIFKKKTEISIDENIPEIFNRVNVFRIITNTASKFVIFSNITCVSDRNQIEAFCKFCNYEYKLGLNKLRNNLYLIITSIDNIDPHVVQPDENFCSYLSNYFWNDDESRRISMVNYFVNMMKKFHDTDFKYKIIYSLFSTIPNYFKFTLKRNSNDVFDIILNENAYLRVMYLNKSKNLVIPSLRMRKSILNMDIIYDYVISSNSRIDESDTWVNIFKEAIPINDYHLWFQNIISHYKTFSNE